MAKTVSTTILALLLGSFLVVPAAARQTQPSSKPAQPQAAAVTAQLVKGNLYWIKGGNGANTAFYIGANSVIIIDAKMTADAAKQMIAEISKVTDKPIKMIIITHSDGDHVNGLIGFSMGLEIVASANCKSEMEEAFKDEKMAAFRAFLPNRTYPSLTTLTLGEPPVQLMHFGAAHTSGDTTVVFPAERVAFVGDLAFVGRDPLIHRQKGGTSIGYIATLKKLLDLPVDTFLSGHADPLTKNDLKTLLGALEEKMAKVEALVKEGKTLDEVKAAFGIAPAAAGQPSRWPSLVEVIYLDLTEKK